MAVNTQLNDSLILTLDGTSVQCQIIDLTWTPPGPGAGTTTFTACPDGVVSEPGSPQDGSITGTAFTDSGSDGLWWLLDDAYRSGAEIAFVLTWFPEGGPTTGVVETGVCKAQAAPLSFSKPGINKHPVNLTVIKSTKSRPAAA